MFVTCYPKRTLCSKAVVAAYWCAAACSLLAATAANSAADRPAAKEFRKTAVIRFEGEITPWLEGYLDRKLAAAKRAGADLIVLQIDSPGGYLEESGNMAARLQELTWAHTVAYIPREALSGGAYVALGCDEIVMHPTARLGDVGVIFLDQDFMFRYAPEKYQSNLVQEMRILAVAQGRPPALAEAMVDMNCEVFRVKNTKTGEISFLSEQELNSSPEREHLQKLDLVIESQKGRFLTVSGQRAVELKLADANVKSWQELQQRYKVSQRWVEYRPNNVDKAVYVLNLWWVTGLLLVVGMVGIFKEMAAPGTLMGMTIAGLCFALFFWSRYLTGTSGTLEVLLFVAGLAFLAVELFILPGFGIAGVLGIVLLLGSLVLACQNFIVPQTERELLTLGATVLLVSGSTLSFLVIASVMINYIGSVPILNRLMLAPPGSATGDVDGSDKKVSAPLTLQVGDRGTAESPLRPAGRARFAGEFFDVVSDGDFIDRGTAIQIVEFDSYRVVVRVATESSSPAVPL